MEYKIPENAKIQQIDSNYTMKGEYSYSVGLYIKTDKGDIKLLIDDRQSCCEDFGALYLETPDDEEKFIDATILKIEDVCIGLTANPDNLTGDETQLKVTTSKGVLQFAVYNFHNGYYSHAVIRQVFDETEHLSL